MNTSQLGQLLKAQTASYVKSDRLRHNLLCSSSGLVAIVFVLMLSATYAMTRDKKTK